LEKALKAKHLYEFDLSNFFGTVPVRQALELERREGHLPRDLETDITLMSHMLPELPKDPIRKLRDVETICTPRELKSFLKSYTITFPNGKVMRIEGDDLRKQEYPQGKGIAPLLSTVYMRNRPVLLDDPERFGPKQGFPQGGAISPLLATFYLRHLKVPKG